MDQADLVEKIGNTLTDLDNQLMTPALNADPAKWQIIFAQRKHLDDQQRELVQETIQDDDVAFKTNAALIDAATAKLQTLLDQITKIDSVITTIAQISSSLDSILSIVPGL